MKIHAIMVTYRRSAQAEQTLAAIRQQTRLPDTMTIVDNSPAMERYPTRLSDAWGSSLQYFPMERNAGPAGAIAYGMTKVLETARHDDWVLLIDDDDPPPDASTIEHLQQLASEADARVAGVGLSGARFNSRKGIVIRLTDAELSEGIVEVDHIGGGSFPLYRLEVIAEVGVFDQSLFWGFEELEFGLRVRDGGWALVVDGPRMLNRRRSIDRLDLGRSLASMRLEEPSWRTYYARRNIILVLRRRHEWLGMMRATTVGIVKPFLNFPRHPNRALTSLRLQAKAAYDAFSGRSGVTPISVAEVNGPAE